METSSSNKVVFLLCARRRNYNSCAYVAHSPVGEVIKEAIAVQSGRGYGRGRCGCYGSKGSDVQGLTCRVSGRAGERAGGRATHAEA